MLKESFKNYLLKNGFTENTTGSYQSGINHLSRDLGEDCFEITNIERVRQIRRIYDRGGLKQEVGDALSGAARAAIIQFERFIESGVFDSSGASAENELPQIPDRRLTYERDLQKAIENQVSELFPGYEIVGSEYVIENCRIDLLLKKTTNFLVVELKSGTANYQVFGQISMYMGLVGKKFPDSSVKGVIVAGNVDSGLVAACSTNDLITCKQYEIKLRLEDA